MADDPLGRAPADDARLESLIENADCRWCDSEFRIDGADLMKLLRAASTLAPVAPPAQPADGWVMVPRVLTDDMVRAWASSEADMRPSLPEIPEWVRLDKDSEEAWWRWSKEQAARDWADFLAAAPAAPAAQPEGWIACAERMPAVHTLGLVSNADGSRMTVAESWYGGRWRTSAHLASEEVTYWRPLPPAPKREGGA